MTQRGKERKTEAAIAALLEYPTIAEAAESCGISKRTLLRWMRHEGFQKQYREVKRALLAQATARLRAESGAAVEALAKVVATGDEWTEPVFYKGEICGKVKKFSPTARVSAATKIIEMALHSHQIEDLETRISQLERNLQK